MTILEQAEAILLGFMHISMLELLREHAAGFSSQVFQRVPAIAASLRRFAFSMGLASGLLTAATRQPEIERPRRSSSLDLTPRYWQAVGNVLLYSLRMDFILRKAEAERTKLAEDEVSQGIDRVLPYLRSLVDMERHAP